jgi:2-phosphosulfolactate phosphatase
MKTKKSGKSSKVKTSPAQKSVEVLFAPAEFERLASRDLSDTVCVVFDILRATSTMVTALKNGAVAIIPVMDIDDAVRLKQKHPQVLLGGERHGVRITAKETGGIDFDLGNSPLEYEKATVGGKTIVVTTTNGTRALRSCATAKEVLVGSFLNMRALTRQILKSKPDKLLIICSGTYEESSLEDTLAAGALCAGLKSLISKAPPSDSVTMARMIFERWRKNIFAGFKQARNGARLLQMPALRKDVSYCARLNSANFVPTLLPDGSVRI